MCVKNVVHSRTSLQDQCSLDLPVADHAAAADSLLDF